MLAPATFSNLNMFSSVANIIDYDDDGDLDVMVSGYMSDNSAYSSSLCKVFINRTIDEEGGTHNETPSTPSNLRATQDSLGVHFEWNPSNDDHTPASALTYDLLLYKNGKVIHRSAVDPATTFRNRMLFGQFSNMATLNLEQGTYEFRVQAVDQSYRGSELSTSFSIDVVPAPPLMRDTTIVSCGNIITLTAVGSNIEWFSDASLSKRVASGQFHPTESQRVYVTQTVNGIRGIANVVNIKVIERPPVPVLRVANPVRYCEGSPYIHLEADGSNVKWYSTKELLPTSLQSSNFYFNPDPRPAKYYVTQSIGTCESFPLEVVVEPLGLTTSLTLEGDKIVAKSFDGATYYWYRNKALIQVNSSNSLQYDGNTASYQVGIEKSGCYAVSPSFLVSAIEGVSESPIQLYPNPASDQFSIEGAEYPTYIRVYNNNGILVLKTTIASEHQSINTANWSPGLYAVTVFDGKETKTIKLVKE